MYVYSIVYFSLLLPSVPGPALSVSYRERRRPYTEQRPPVLREHHRLVQDKRRGTTE